MRMCILIFVAALIGCSSGSSANTTGTGGSGTGGIGAMGGAAALGGNSAGGTGGLPSGSNIYGTVTDVNGVTSNFDCGGTAIGMYNSGAVDQGSVKMYCSDVIQRPGPTSQVSLSYYISISVSPVVGVHTYPSSVDGGSTGDGGVDIAFAQWIIYSSMGGGTYEAGLESLSADNTVIVTVDSWDPSSSHITGSAQAMFYIQQSSSDALGSASINVMFDVQF